MSSPFPLLSRLPAPLGALGVVVLSLGVVMQARGIALPDPLPALTGAATAFGAMARIGGALVLAGLFLFALIQLRAPDAGPDGAAAARAPRGRVTADDEDDPDDLPPSITPVRMAEWQRRLAEKAATPESGTTSPAPARGHIARGLHRAALAVVATAFVGLLAITVWGQVAPGLTGTQVAAAPEAAVTPPETAP
ncbi:MAG: hypothetical protein IT542_09665 [Rubellimicrobium sp.]|nr:hypothetical protein [Rubellimicrobium sp.]